MKKLALVLTFAAFAWAGTARAEMGTMDNVPAATLLLPYFEVDLADANGVNTVFTVNNASATAAMAHVTLWTDEGIPTFNFDVYLTGYDVQQINLRDIFDSGSLPITADAGADPADTFLPDTGISNKGPLSQDINFPGTTGPCEAASVYTDPELSEVERRHIRAAHTGRRSDVLNGCAGAQYGDLIARGYVTVDAVSDCSLLNPSDSGYFTGIARDQNVLWGDFSIERPLSNALSASALVHIESCRDNVMPPLYIGVGNGAGLCPFASGDYTFYGRLNGFTATDLREPLATTFGARYVNGGLFDAGTDLLVWRDVKVPPTGANGKHHCVTEEPAWFPLGQSEVVAFDEAEQASDLCDGTECFPLAAQRVPTATGNPVGDPLATPALSGWLYLNLNHTGGSSIPGVAQAWVTTTTTANSRFAVGSHAVPFDNATATASGGFILIP